MIFDLLSTSGNGKYAKLRKDSISVELPTIMEPKFEDESGYWIVGDVSGKYEIDFPPKSIDQKIKTSDRDLVFIANFLMHNSLDKETIYKQLDANQAIIEKQLKTIGKDKAIVLIHPNNSTEALNKVLNKIAELKIRHVGISNFLPLLNNPRQAMEFLGVVRSSLPFDTILYLLSPVPHTFMPILAYAGIDVFSNAFSGIASKDNLYLNTLGGSHLDELKEQTCICEYCSKYDIADLSKQLVSNKRELLEKHNLLVIQSKIREIRQAMKNNDLRSYLEKIIGTNVFTASSLRLLDSLWSEQLISRTSTWLSTPVYHITNYSYHRPAIKEFQRRIRERFKIKSTKKIVVIFPCSARKPYSQSRSHKLFLESLAVIDRKKKGYIQEIILTSPLGVIPRELELTYPAAHYDIPVTGFWDEEEKQMAITQLTAVLSKINDNDVTVIAHISGEYIELCEGAEKELGMKFIYTAKESKVTSQKALSKLKEELMKHTTELEPMTHSKDVEFLQTIADYQFGEGIGEKMFQGYYRLSQKPKQNIRIMKDGKQKSVIQHKTGQLMLTKETGKTLVALKKYYLVFDGEELKGSTIFNVGVKEADPNIRPTDVIVILNALGEFKAVGTATASGKDMVAMSTGQAAKIRLKIKD